MKGDRGVDASEGRSRPIERAIDRALAAAEAKLASRPEALCEVREIVERVKRILREYFRRRTPHKLAEEARRRGMTPETLRVRCQKGLEDRSFKWPNSRLWMFWPEGSQDV